MTTQHTKGPYEVHVGEDYVHIYGNGRHDHSGDPIASVCDEAHATLLAASPTLLKQLERIVTAYNTRIIVNEDIENIKTLIAKAKGTL